MEEIWKEITGYECRYMVSNLGRIKSIGRDVCGIYGCRFMPERIMVLHNNNNGYKVIWLRKPRIHKKHYIHRLVAKAFLPNPENLPVVNHKNRDRHHNHVENLEWVSYSENTDHYYQSRNNDDF